MMSESDAAFSTNHQDPYIRARENPYFEGLLRVLDQLPLNSKDNTNFEETRLEKLVLDDMFEMVIDHIPAVNSEDFEVEHSLQSHTIPQNIEKTYTITRRKEKLSNMMLPISAALYYNNGVSSDAEIVESCETINNLNAFLRGRKDDVNAGVPGKFLHAVIGSDHADVGTVVSTIMYSFYLSMTMKKDQLCIVPIININRANLASHVELKWLLDSCQIDQSSLIFADEIDMSYYDLFGSLKILLLKSSKIANKQEKLKQAVVEIFHCRKDEKIYPWVETVTIREESSCCTAIAEKFATFSPEILTSKSFSKLLLCGILLESGNLRDPECSSKDKYMASLLINAAGRYGCNGLYQLLRYKMQDLSSLPVADILRKDFKKWTTGQESADSRSKSQIGMSCITISIQQLLSHTQSFAQELTHFQSMEKLRVLIIVSGYYNDEKNFKREVLLSTESVKLLESLLFFFDFNASRLPLKTLHFPGLKNEMKVYEIDKITSRKTIEHLIEEFVGIPKA